MKKYSTLRLPGFAEDSTSPLYCGFRCFSHEARIQLLNQPGFHGSKERLKTQSVFLVPKTVGGRMVIKLHLLWDLPWTLQAPGCLSKAYGLVHNRSMGCPFNKGYGYPTVSTVDGRIPANQLRLFFFIIYRFFFTSQVVGRISEPSTVGIPIMGK